MGGETMIKELLTVLIGTTCYAVLRYAVFGDVSPLHIPGYIMNKSIAMAAVLSLFLSAFQGGSARRERLRFWSQACSHLLFLHVLLSLAILSKGYYAKFFDGERMNLTGEAMLLLGVLAAYCFLRLAADRIGAAARRKLTLSACALVAGHLFVMGYAGWPQVGKWHGGLPPITLLCFVLALLSLLCFLKQEAPVSGAMPDEDAVLPERGEG